MRIIAGTARSLPLASVEGIDTRPTTDRIKETLFNILQKDIPGCTFLDLFAGSGSIALEAVSRGAKKAVLVEKNRKAVKCIQSNIDFTGFGGQCDLIPMDYLDALHLIEGKYVFDLVYLDPPYGKGMARAALDALKKSRLIGADSQLIVEESIDFDPGTLEDGYTIIRIKQYKTNQHIFLERTSSFPDEPAVVISHGSH